MTPLRRRMLEDMQLRGFSARTQGCYVAAVRQLAARSRYVRTGRSSVTCLAVLKGPELTE